MIPNNARVPGSYNDVNTGGGSNGSQIYRQPILVIAPRIKTPSVWATETTYALGQTVRPTTGNDDHYYYICITAGTGGGTEPTWPGAGGTVTDGTAVLREFCFARYIANVNIPVSCFSGADGAKYAGTGSLAHRMVRAIFRKHRYAEVTLVLVDDDVSGVCATAAITIAGTAVGTGSMVLRVGNDPVRISWSDGDTASDIAAALDAAIAAKHDLPVTSSVSGAVVTQRVKNAGVPGNEIGKFDSDTVVHKSTADVTGDGITVTIAGFASGAVDPDITDALTAATSGAYAIITCPYRDSDNVAAAREWLEAVSDSTNCNGARMFFGITSSFASASTFAGANYERFNLAWALKVRYPSFEIAAEFAAMLAATGHPALSINDEALIGCDSQDIADIPGWNEINVALWSGVTPFVTDGNGVVRCVRAITTYTLSSSGSPDETYLDTTAVACFDYIRKDNKVWDRTHLANKVLRINHVDGEPEFIITPGDIRSIRFARAKVHEKFGVCQNVDMYKDLFVSASDPSVTGRVNSSIPTQIVQGLHILANTIQVVSDN